VLLVDLAIRRAQGNDPITAAHAEVAIVRWFTRSVTLELVGVSTKLGSNEEIDAQTRYPF
jgi:hypothetical protein